MRIRLPPALAAGAAVLSLAGAAAAAVVDRVQVGVSGRNETKGLSAALYVDVPVVAGYRQSAFSGNNGTWQGPDYHATQSSKSGRTVLSFRAVFHSGVGSLDGMASRSGVLVHTTWTRVQKTARQVPRLLGGRTVGTVAAELVLYEEPITGSARYESVLAIPLCHGVFGAVDFYAGAPSQDVSGSAGQYLVGTTQAKQWNHDHALAAPASVKLDGPLPGGSISAHAVGKAVAGATADCGGGLRKVPLVLQRKSGASWVSAGHGISGSGGKFRLAAPGAGSYRVLVALGPFKAVSSTVDVR